MIQILPTRSIFSWIYLALLFLNSVEIKAQKKDTSDWISFGADTRGARIRRAILPSTFPVLITGYGVAAIGPSTVIYDRFQAKHDIQQAFPGFYSPADNYLQFAPAAATFSLSLCGVKGKHSLGEQIILYASSMLVSEGIATGLKYTTKVLRPDNSAYNSFPSGHTTSAFTGAEMMNQEYKGSSFLYSMFGYGTATATGMMRMMNNRHWLSDVMVGAGIGMISTKVVYAVYPVLKRKYLQKRTRRTSYPGS